MTKLLQQCFLFFIVVVIFGHNLGNSQVGVYGTIGPTLVASIVKERITVLVFQPGKDSIPFYFKIIVL